MTTATPTDLSQSWAALRDAQPRLRIRDAARQLGVSEGRPLAPRTGRGVRRLRPEWPALFEGLCGLGPVMALTRNEHAVIEKDGAYADVSFQGHVGLVLGGAIDLRLFPHAFAHAFAVTDEGPRGTMRSLQVFGGDGTALHKVFLREASDVAAYESLVESLLSDDQGPGFEERAGRPARPEQPDADIDREALLEGWRGMQDTHDFHGLLMKSGVGREQALRLAEGEFARRAPRDAQRYVLCAAAELDVPIMVFVGSPGVIEIHSGPVVKLAEHGEWFNVMDPDFNLHLHEPGLARSWVVTKPTADGVVTSLEVYDEAGQVVVQFFGVRKPGRPEDAEWRSIVESVPRA